MAAELMITDIREFKNEHLRWIVAVNVLHVIGEGNIIDRAHTFFGKLTKKEWGILNYKYLDHHLRQFGA